MTPPRPEVVRGVRFRVCRVFHCVCRRSIQTIQSIQSIQTFQTERTVKERRVSFPLGPGFQRKERRLAQDLAEQQSSHNCAGPTCRGGGRSAQGLSASGVLLACAPSRSPP